MRHMIQRFSHDAMLSPLWAFTTMLVATIAGVVIVTGAFRIADAVATSRPPLDVAIEVTTDGETVAMILSGEKLTNRALISQTFGWRFSDGSVLPMPVFLDNGELIVARPLLQEADQFVTPILRMEVPPSVLGDLGAVLRICWHYEDRDPWCVDTPYQQIEEVTSVSVRDDGTTMANFPRMFAME